MEERLPDYFGILPKAEMVVKRVEPFREQMQARRFTKSPPMAQTRYLLRQPLR